MIDNSKEKMKEYSDYVCEKLEGNDRKFIESLYYLAQVEVSKIECNKKKIIGEINEIKKFLIDLDNQKRGIIAIRKMFGFVEANKFSEENVQVDKNFYLFVADIKIKAVAFILRAYCFFNKYENNRNIVKEAREYIEKFRNEYKDKEIELIGEYLGTFKEQNNNIGIEMEDYICVDKRIEKFDEKQHTEKVKKYKLTEEAVELVNNNIELVFEVSIPEEAAGLRVIMDIIVNEFPLPDKSAERLLDKLTADILVQSPRYFLFDNSMNEVSFYGVESKFLWLWETEEQVTLFRNVTPKEIDEKLENKTGIEYMKSLMETIRVHVGGGNIENAISYSRNPIRDFYKYIDMSKEKKLLDIECKMTISPKMLEMNTKFEPKVEINIKKLETEGKTGEYPVAIFEIVEDVKVNSLKVINKNGEERIIEFYEFFGEDVKEIQKTKFCVEFCKENKIVPKTSGRRLDKLYNYLCTWDAVSCNFQKGIISEADEEVVVSVGYFNNEEKNNGIPIAKQYKLNIIQIMKIMFEFLKFEPRFATDENGDLRKKKVKEYMVKKVREKIENQLKWYRIPLTHSTYSKIKCDDIKLEVSICLEEEFNANEEKKNELETKIKDFLLKELPNKIAEQLMELIDGEKNENLEKIVELVGNTVKKNGNYKDARQKKYKLYSKNKEINFWKEIFKEC